MIDGNKRAGRENICSCTTAEEVGRYMGTDMLENAEKEKWGNM